MDKPCVRFERPANGIVSLAYSQIWLAGQPEWSGAIYKDYEYGCTVWRVRLDGQPTWHEVFLTLRSAKARVREILEAGE